MVDLIAKARSEQGRGVSRDTLDFLLSEYDRLTAENTKIRAALEAAPEPPQEGMAACTEYAVACYRWHTGPRAEALKS